LSADGTDKFEKNKVVTGHAVNGNRK